MIVEIYRGSEYKALRLSDLAGTVIKQVLNGLSPVSMIDSPLVALKKW